MSTASLFVNGAITFAFFIITFIVSIMLVIFLRIRTEGWKPPSLPTSSHEVIDTGPPFCSAKAVRKRYDQRITHYTIPRALYISGLATTLFAYKAVGLIPPLVFGSIMFVLISLFFLYIMDSVRIHYF